MALMCWRGGYLGNSRAAVSANRLDSLGVEHGVFLVQALIHVAHIALLGLENAGEVNL